MIEDPTQLGIVVIITAAVLLFLFVMWTLIVRSRRSRAFKPGESLNQVKDAHIDEGERPASIVSEQIEEKVKEILKAEGKTLEQGIDFVTGAGGSLEIWIGEECYKEVDEIPREDIRNAVKKAVSEFNR